jgi:hypothetical protein
LADFVEVRVELAIVAVIGSRLGLPRSEQLSRFDGCHRVPSHRPVCPSYPSPSAAPGLLAISSYIRFFKDISIESRQSTLQQKPLNKQFSTQTQLYRLLGLISQPDEL